MEREPERRKSKRRGMEEQSERGKMQPGDWDVVVGRTGGKMEKVPPRRKSIREG